MKKLLIVFVATLLFYSCSSPLDRKYSKETFQDDLEALVKEEKIDSAATMKIAGYLMYATMSGESIDGLSYREIIVKSDELKKKNKEEGEAQQKIAEEEERKRKEEEDAMYNNWVKRNMVDEFGDPIDDYTIRSMFRGEFTNSATASEKMSVMCDVTVEKYVYFSVYEYNRSNKANLPREKFINIDVKLKDGSVTSSRFFMFQDYFTTSDKDFYNLLISDNPPVKISIDMSKTNEYSRTKYVFEINTEGLKGID